LVIPVCHFEIVVWEQPVSRIDSFGLIGEGTGAAAAIRVGFDLAPITTVDDCFEDAEEELDAFEGWVSQLQLTKRTW
jgi:hypothetical protein